MRRCLSICVYPTLLGCLSAGDRLPQQQGVGHAKPSTLLAAAGFTWRCSQKCSCSILLFQQGPTGGTVSSGTCRLPLEHLNCEDGAASIGSDARESHHREMSAVSKEILLISKSDPARSLVSTEQFRLAAGTSRLNQGI